MQKRMFIAAIIIALIAATATAFFRGDLGGNKNTELSHMEELFAMKDTPITDKVAVGKLVKAANATQYEIAGVDIWNDAGDDSFRLDVVMVSLNSVNNNGIFVILFTHINTDLNV